MGIFHEMVQVFNKAPVPLTVRFDGQQIEIPVGPSLLPKQVISYAKNQNPVMGSQDADNPNITGARYLIAVVGKKGEDCTPLTPEEWAEHLGKPCRVDTDALFDGMLDSKERVFVKGRKKAKASYAEASVSLGHEFGGLD